MRAGAASKFLDGHCKLIVLETQHAAFGMATTLNIEPVTIDKRKS
jgi:hypothetical protein